MSDPRNTWVPFSAISFLLDNPRPFGLLASLLCVGLILLGVIFWPVAQLRPTQLGATGRSLVGRLLVLLLVEQGKKERQGNLSLPWYHVEKKKEESKRVWMARMNDGWLRWSSTRFSIVSFLWNISKRSFTILWILIAIYQIITLDNRLYGDPLCYIKE